MDSKKSTDIVLDILYDELTPEDARNAVQALEQNQDLLDDFTSLQATRTQFNDALPTQNVPQSLHDAIIAAAQHNLHLQESQKNQPQQPDKLPIAPRPPTTTLWARIRSLPRTQLAAITTVAALLLASAVFLRQFQAPPSQEKFTSASANLTHEVQINPYDHPTPTLKPVAIAAAPAQLHESTPPNQPHEFEVPSEKREEAKGRSQQSDLEDLVEGSAPTPKRRATRAAPPRKASARSAAAPTSGRASTQHDDAYAKPTESSREARKPTSLAYRPPAPEPAPTPQAVSKTADFAPQAELEKADRAAEIAANTPLQKAESALNNREFANAITLAEQAHQSPNNTPDARARALEIKALAQIQLGQPQNADQTYQTLQQQHPNYRTTQIQRARNNLANPNSP